MSDKYIFQKDLSSEKKLEGILRKKINQWANSKPHHPFKNLGDLISVDSIWYKPAYPIKLFSQYESRSKHEGHEPYTNQKVPNRTLFSIKDFNSWEIQLSVVKDFINEVTDNAVPNSQHIEECFKCNARGWLTCSQCGGDKTVSCPKCSGKGYNSCGSCGGSGKHRCSQCSGSGRINRSVQRQRQVTKFYSDGSSRIETEYYTDYVTETCLNCNGRGENKCTQCNGAGKIICSKCNGTGRITCPTCSGKGIVTCPVCNGQKNLMHSYYINRQLEYSNQETCVIHSHVFNNFPEFLDNYKDYDTKHLHTERKEKLEINQLPEGHHLNEFINKQLKKSHDKSTSTKVMLFQQLEIYCIDTWELSYSFRGKSYKMVFTGGQYNIIPGLSPIYEVAFDYWDQAVTSSKFFRLSHAHNLLKKSLKINVYEIKNDVESALFKLRSKINQSYNFGALLGTFISMFFGGFLAYFYFKEVNYVNDFATFINQEDSLLYPYHAWTQTILYIVLVGIAFFFVKDWLNKAKWIIPGSIIRALAGFGTMVIVSLIILGLLGLLNFIGLTIIVTLLLWLAKWIILIIWYVVVFIIALIIWIFKAVWGVLNWILGLFS